MLDYWKVDAACFILGVSFIICAIKDQDYHEILFSVAWVWAYPLLL